MAKLKRRLEQIYQKIDSIAKLGKDGFNNYGMYIDELLSSGEWSLFSDVMIRKYNINTQLYRSVEDIKSKTFDKIRFVILSQFHLYHHSVLLRQA